MSMPCDAPSHFQNPAIRRRNVGWLVGGGLKFSPTNKKQTIRINAKLRLENNCRVTVELAGREEE
jgi:hypothetical protein